MLKKIILMIAVVTPFLLPFLASAETVKTQIRNDNANRLNRIFWEMRTATETRKTVIEAGAIASIEDLNPSLPFSHFIRYKSHNYPVLCYMHVTREDMAACPSKVLIHFFRFVHAGKCINELKCAN